MKTTETETTEALKTKKNDYYLVDAKNSYAALIEENPTFLKRAFMEDLIGLLNDKKSTVEDVSSIFR